jgi:hypothetical protein
MDRVHQGLAGTVLLIEPVKIIAADLKGDESPGCILDPEPAQIFALAQEECPDEDVRGLVAFYDQHLL